MFYNPTKLIFGKDTIKKIGNEISALGINKVLLLAGSGSIKSNGVYEQTLNSLKTNCVEVVEHWGVSPNPILSHANSGIALCKKEKVQAILAVGGGSVIDEAKSIAAGFYLEDLWASFERAADIKNALPIFTILTLSGTGSEMNPYAVLTNEVEQKKWNIGSPLLYPKATVIDPSVQMSLPWHQTVNGGIDAISHIMESYFSSTDQETSISMAESLIKSIIKSLDALMIDEMNYEARANLAWAATLALNGTIGSSTMGEWSAHRIEHGISALYPHIAHGAGLAVVFPAWIEYTKDKNPTQYQRFAREIWNCDSIEEAIAAMKNKFSNWKAPISLRNLNIPEDRIADLAFNASRLGVVGNMYPMTEKEMFEILKIAY